MGRLPAVRVISSTDWSLNNRGVLRWNFPPRIIDGFTMKLKTLRLFAIVSPLMLRRYCIGFPVFPGGAISHAKSICALFGGVGDRKLRGVAGPAAAVLPVMATKIPMAVAVAYN